MQTTIHEVLVRLDENKIENHFYIKLKLWDFPKYYR